MDSYRYQSIQTSQIGDPISLENIDISSDWICKEPVVMIEDVRGQEFVELAQLRVGEDERTEAFEDLSEGVGAFENAEWR